MGTGVAKSNRPQTTALAERKKEVMATLQSQAVINYIKVQQDGDELKARKTVSAMQLLLTRKPDILMCDSKSIVQACCEVVSLGLRVDHQLQEAHFIPYKNKGKQELQLQIGYQGWLELARKSHQIRSIQCHVVKQQDHFEYEFGLEPILVHKPAKLIDRKADNDITHAYAVAKLTNGDMQMDVVTQDDVDRIKKSSQSASSQYSPWQTHAEWMWKKTAVKQLCKLLPRHDDLSRAVHDDDLAESGQMQQFDIPISDDDIEGEVISDEQSAKDAI